MALALGGATFFTGHTNFNVLMPVLPLSNPSATMFESILDNRFFGLFRYARMDIHVGRHRFYRDSNSALSKESSFGVSQVWHRTNCSLIRPKNAAAFMGSGVGCIEVFRFFGRGMNSPITGQIQSYSGSPPHVLPYNLHADAVSYANFPNDGAIRFMAFVINCGVFDYDEIHPSRAKPSTISLSSITGDLVRFLRFQQCPDNQASADEAEESGKPRRKYLFFGGISSPYLGLQIAGIVGAAFGLSACCGYSLFRAFNHGNRKWRWRALATLSGLLSLFFWGWGWAGNPLSAWGLAP